MNQAAVVETLKGYVGREILDGEDIGLEASTPLIEWGIVNSLEISRLVAFISERYGVAIPNDQIVLENFENLEALAGLVLGLQPS